MHYPSHQSCYHLKAFFNHQKFRTLLRKSGFYSFSPQNTFESLILPEDDSLYFILLPHPNPIQQQKLPYRTIIYYIFFFLPLRLFSSLRLMMIYCDIGYLKDGNSAYIGSMMGRVANRIANGEFELSGEKHVLAKNFLGKHSLHGGVIGFDKFNWDSYVDGTTVYLTHVSPDEYEGYPGTVLITAECKLSDDGSFSMNITAVSSKPTIINMSNHSYFNLAGHETGYKELYKHKLTMNSDKVLKISPEQIPTGEFQDVGDSAFDFRLPVDLGTAISKTPGNGFDYNFCVTSGSSQDLTFVARVLHPGSGRTMEVYSDQPSVLFYTGNNLPDPCGNVRTFILNFDVRSHF